MSKYSLPQTTSPLMMRHVIVWGLPFLGWVILIVAWLMLSSSEPEEKPTTTAPQTEQVASQQVPAQPQLPTPQPLPQPVQQPQPLPAPVQPTQPVNNVPAPTQTVTMPLDSAPSFVPYNFKTAVAQAGLPKEASCNTGILVDTATRKVLWAKGAERAVPIASMTKMMTMLLAEEAIAQGRVTRETRIPVTVNAYKIGGSQVWLDPKEVFPLSELLKAVAIKSANDAAYLVSEYLGDGDASTFVARMNARARELGMSHTSFYDAHGLGDSQKRNNLASAYDMVILAERLLAYPEVMKLAATRMDTFRNGKTELRNHNNLVFHRVPGVDGLKTGYTEASGFCVTFTCLRAGRRLIGCVTGFKTAKDRDAFCRALLDWGYSQN